MTIEHTYAHK